MREQLEYEVEDEHVGTPSSQQPSRPASALTSPEVGANDADVGGQTRLGPILLQLGTGNWLETV